MYLSLVFHLKTNSLVTLDSFWALLLTRLILAVTVPVAAYHPLCSISGTAPHLLKVTVHSHSLPDIFYSLLLLLRHSVSVELAF